MSNETPSINRLTSTLVEALVRQASQLRLSVSHEKNGVRIIDAGIKVPGSVMAGQRIAEICMGSLGAVNITTNTSTPNWPWTLCVSSMQPVLACLGSQYAGWSLSHKEGEESFFALGSGPARALANKEELFKTLGYQDKIETDECACLVLETDKLPPLALLDKIAEQCSIAPKQLTLILTPSSSLAGCTQVVSRVLEVALHKAHYLGFEIENIIDGMGSAPLCPPSPDFLTAMSRTNDAILFGGQVHLFVSGTDQAAQELAQQMPSETSKDYGEPFGDIFKAVDYDFYKVDPLLFAPAKVAISNVTTGNTFHAGQINTPLLERSFS